MHWQSHFRNTVSGILTYHILYAASDPLRRSLYCRLPTGVKHTIFRNCTWSRKAKVSHKGVTVLVQECESQNAADEHLKYKITPMYRFTELALSHIPLTAYASNIGMPMVHTQDPGPVS